MLVHLKVKIKSLAEEARIIRKEETRAKDKITRESLCNHRIHVVRRECRNTHLAYGFLRGKTYDQLERNCETPPDWKKVFAMVKKYGPSNPNLELQLKDWKK